MTTVSLLKKLFKKVAKIPPGELQGRADVVKPFGQLKMKGQKLKMMRINPKSEMVRAGCSRVGERGSGAAVQIAAAGLPTRPRSGVAGCSCAGKRGSGTIDHVAAAVTAAVRGSGWGEQSGEFCSLFIAYSRLPGRRICWALRVNPAKSG